MFIEVQVRVDMPGCSLSSRSAMCGASRFWQIGLIFVTMRSYYFRTYRS